MNVSAEKMLLRIEKYSRQLRGLNGNVDLSEPEIDDHIRNAALSLDAALNDAKRTKACGPKAAK